MTWWTVRRWPSASAGRGRLAGRGMALRAIGRWLALGGAAAYDSIKDIAYLAWITAAITAAEYETLVASAQTL